MTASSGDLEGGLRTHGVRLATASDQPLLSIVTVVYNGAATLERTIQSVLEQDYPSVEHIVIDGGSTDGTLDVIRRYDAQLAYWTSGPDNGIYDAMNKGIALASGDWVGLINADDWYATDALSKAMHHVSGKPDVNIVHGDVWLHYSNGAKKLKRPKSPGFLLKHWEMVLNHPSFFVRRSYYATHPFDATLSIAADHQWTLRAWLDDPSQLLYAPETLAHFSAGGASMMVSLPEKLREGAQVGRSVGMSRAELWTGHVVRTALYLPQRAKIFANQHPLRRR